MYSVPEYCFLKLLLSLSTSYTHQTNIFLKVHKILTCFLHTPKFFIFLCCLVEKIEKNISYCTKILLASMKTPNNFESCPESRIRISHAASFLCYWWSVFSCDHLSLDGGKIPLNIHNITHHERFTERISESRPGSRVTGGYLNAAAFSSWRGFLKGFLKLVGVFKEESNKKARQSFQRAGGPATPRGSEGTLWPGFQAYTWSMFILKSVAIRYRKEVGWKSRYS